MTAYAGIDLHRRRSLAVCLDEGGERWWWRRFDNSPVTMAEVVATRPQWVTPTNTGSSRCGT